MLGHVRQSGWRPNPNHSRRPAPMVWRWHARARTIALRRAAPGRRPASRGAPDVARWQAALDEGGHRAERVVAPLVGDAARDRPTRAGAGAVDLVAAPCGRWVERHGSALPDADARWALAQVRASYGAVPVVLLGHSMGARTAVRVADDPAVVGVVALAPWFPPRRAGRRAGGQAADGVPGPSGPDHVVRRHRAVHRAVHRAGGRAGGRAAGEQARLVDMGPIGHYMLRSRRRWNQAALSAAADMVVETAE